MLRASTLEMRSRAYLGQQQQQQQQQGSLHFPGSYLPPLCLSRPARSKTVPGRCT